MSGGSKHSGPRWADRLGIIRPLGQVNAALRSARRAVVRRFRKTRLRVPTLESTANAATGLRRLITETLTLGVILLLIYGAVSELRGNALTVLPVSVPPMLETLGYNQVAASQRIARQMMAIVGKQPSDSSDISMSQSADLILGSQELPDIQVPGQAFSFRAAFRFVRRALGISDTTLNISISDEGDRFLADILVIGGPYGGAQETISVEKGTLVEDLTFEIALQAVKIALPLSYAVYLTELDPRCSLADSCVLDERLERALAVLSRVLGDEYMGDDASAHLAASAVLLRAGNAMEAGYHCQEAIDEDPILGWAYILCGYSFLLQENDARALEYASLASEAKIDDAQMRAGLGNLFLAMNQADRAADEYRAALDLNARHVYSLIGLGTSFRRDCFFEEAATFYRAALIVNPVEPDAHGGLGIALYHLGLWDEAIEHLERISSPAGGTYSAVLAAIQRGQPPPPCVPPSDSASAP